MARSGNRHLRCAFLCLAAIALSGSAAAGENWPQWRGPQGNGTSDSTHLPTTWSLEKNIVWKTALPWWSGGTPIVWGDRIFVTSPSKPTSQKEAGQPEANDQQVRPRRAEQRDRRRGGRPPFRRRGFGRRYGRARDPGGSTLLLLCISRQDGSVLWQRELDEGNRLYMKQNSSSPSPVTDGKHVWTVTGTGAVAAFDINGRRIWGRNLQDDYGTFGLNWGYASSPLLFDGKLIVEVLHGNNTDDPSYLIAFDGTTGEVLWRRERATDALRESPDAYTTPALLNAGGEHQIVISGGDYVTGHDPETGQELWRVAGLNPRRDPNYRIVGSPVVVDGMIYAPSRRRPLLALRVGGDAGARQVELAWKWEDDGGPDVPTPVSDGKYFYMVEDRGLVTCLNAKTGQLVWGPKRTGTGTVSASPLLADGKLYVTNENAVTTVIAAGPEFKVLAKNELDGSYTLSSIAVAGRQLFVRTQSHLFCIGNE